MPPRLLDDPGMYGGCQVYAATTAEALEHRASDRQAAVRRVRLRRHVAELRGLGSFGSEEMAAVSNQYAAMPSMHIGWSTWCALVLAPLVRRRWLRALAVAYPVLTLFDIIVTGNHYWIDGLGGLLCLGVGYAVALVTDLYERRCRPDAGRRRPAQAGGGPQYTGVPWYSPWRAPAPRRRASSVRRTSATGAGRLHPQPGERGVRAWPAAPASSQRDAEAVPRLRRQVLPHDRVDHHRRHAGTGRPAGRPPTRPGRPGRPGPAPAAATANAASSRARRSAWSGQR